jgi:hypothetical protein
LFRRAKVTALAASLDRRAACPLSQMRRAKPDRLSLDAQEGLELFFPDAKAHGFTRDGEIATYG